MKRILNLAILLFIALQLNAQNGKLEFSTIEKNGKNLKTIPRYAIDWKFLEFNIVKLAIHKKDAKKDKRLDSLFYNNSGFLNLNTLLNSKSIKYSNKVGLRLGLVLKNNGLIYDDDTLKHIVRALGASVPLSFSLRTSKNSFLTLNHYFTYNFHYKEKTFDSGSGRHNKNKYTEYSSSRICTYNPSLELGFTLKDFSIGVNWFYMNNFLNKDYKPYSDLKIKQMWEISLVIF